MLKRLPNFLKTFGIGRGFALFAKFYLARRGTGDLFEVQVNGDAISLRDTASDKSIFFQIFVKREYDTAEWKAQNHRLIRAYEAILAQGKIPIIIDAGGNIGLASLWFNHLYPRARIFTIEPDADNLKMLERNVGSRPNITVVPGAVWDHPTRLKISNPDAGAGAFRTIEGEGELRAHSVSELAERETDGELFIVKMDIEGSEAAVFRSNSDWAAAASLLVVETHDWLYPAEATSRHFLRRMSEIPVDFVFRGENVFCFRFDDRHAV